MRASLVLAAALPFALFVPACGGTAVIEEGTGGAASTATSSAVSTATSTATSTAASSTGSGMGPCSAHAQCPGGVCIFATGQCAVACTGDFCPSCGPGAVCDPCATSTCPKCSDCLGACAPVQEGRCDGDDPCAPGSVCIWQSGSCAPSCTTDMDCDEFSFCDACATSSCCGCADCGAACVGGL